MCISISHFSLELISGLNHNHMKDDFSKAAAFQNLVCASNVACLVWSHCFYWTPSELLQATPHPLCCPYSQWILCKQPHDEKSRKGLVKRYFSGSSSAFHSYSKQIWFHTSASWAKPATQSQPCHEKSTGYEGFKAIVKMLSNWKSNCSGREEGLQEILLKYKERSLLWHTYLYIPPRHFILLLRVRKTMTEGQSGSVIQNQITISLCLFTLLKIPGSTVKYY